MQRRLPSKPVKGIARSHLQPVRPGAEAIRMAVAKAYRISAGKVLDHSHADAFKAAVYLLRRAANLPLEEVAVRLLVGQGGPKYA